MYEGEHPLPIDDGFYLSPVIFDDVSASHTIAQEEIFGPVLSVLTFKDERETIELANSTTYGLSAIICTQNLARAYRVLQEVRAGWICVNGTGSPQDSMAVGALPTGGHKESGLGVEGGFEGLNAYTTKQHGRCEPPVSCAMQWSTSAREK